MAPSAKPQSPRAHQTHRLHTVIVVALLLTAATLATYSLLGDSITYDETSKLTAGLSPLLTGDFRLATEHPPLGRVWAAWPLLFLKPRWPPATTRAWEEADVYAFGRLWLFDLNDGERLMRVGRVMMVIVLLATCATVYALGRRLFGASAGLLALTLACLDPTLLAHGRLVGTDVPIALGCALTLWTFARLLEAVTWSRLFWAAVALSAAALTKFSWPLLVPALLVMAIVAVARREPLLVRILPHFRIDFARPGMMRPIARPAARVAVLGATGLFLIAFVWLAIWTGYGWRPTILAPPDPGDAAARARHNRTAELFQRNWEWALETPDGTPRQGILPTLLRSPTFRRLLPEAYAFGLAKTLETTSHRTAFLFGELSNTGWWYYFPVAFAIKTPLPTIALLLAGITAVGIRRARSQDRVLLAGLLAFALVYGAYVIQSHLNIGQRHLLPLYPIAFVLAGASVAWMKTRTGQAAVAAGLVWLAVAVARTHPQYLAYFNELVRGPANGYRCLADSNLDWGQDLKRLAAYARQHPEERIKLAYFGTADPHFYGISFEPLPSSLGIGQDFDLSPGTYVLSATQLLGLYDAAAHDTVWQDRNVVHYYRQLHTRFDPEARLEPPLLITSQDVTDRHWHQQLRWSRLLYHLRRRPPDDRIGYTLFVYRLSAADLSEMTRPP